MGNKIIIIGAGGAGNVAARKCAAAPDIFEDILLASRTLSKCDAIADAIRKQLNRTIRTAEIDADDVEATTALLKREQPDVLINLALPYQDLALMEACLASGVHYLDTANYEPRDDPKFEYKWQWDYQSRFLEAGLTALLGSGFDPGVTNVFCAYAQKHCFDTIETIDILDANAGDHGLPFATNFNPEINIREISRNGMYWEDGEWKETAPLSMHRVYDFPEVGEQDAYLLYHEELESLSRNFPDLKRLRFWMTFSEKYLRHLNVLQNVGMTSIEPIRFEDREIAPIEFLKAVLPDPGTLGPRTRGKTCIGCDIAGHKDGKPKRIFIYNTCDHQACYKEVGSQAISYTTGVPAMVGAQMILQGIWNQPGVWNLEQLDPDPFMQTLNESGLPWHILELET
ncbi:MAG: saccharopine dehydrogenase family protein [Opitutales bacterium]